MVACTRATTSLAARLRGDLPSDPNAPAETVPRLSACLISRPPPILSRRARVDASPAARARGPRLRVHGATCGAVRPPQNHPCPLSVQPSADPVASRHAPAQALRPRARDRGCGAWCHLRGRGSTCGIIRRNGTPVPFQCDPAWALAAFGKQGLIAPCLRRALPLPSPAPRPIRASRAKCPLKDNGRAKRAREGRKRTRFARGEAKDGDGRKGGKGKKNALKGKERRPEGPKNRYFSTIEGKRA